MQKRSRQRPSFQPDGGNGRPTRLDRKGKTADIILVEGDVSKDLGNLRHVETVFLDGYRLDGKALREASGLNGMPK